MLFTVLYNISAASIIPIYPKSFKYYIQTYSQRYIFFLLFFSIIYYYFIFFLKIQTLMLINIKTPTIKKSSSQNLKNTIPSTLIFTPKNINISLQQSKFNSEIHQNSKFNQLQPSQLSQNIIFKPKNKNKNIKMPSLTNSQVLTYFQKESIQFNQIQPNCFLQYNALNQSDKNKQKYSKKLETNKIRSQLIKMNSVDKESKKQVGKYLEVSKSHIMKYRDKGNWNKQNNKNCLSRIISQMNHKSKNIIIEQSQNDNIDYYLGLLFKNTNGYNKTNDQQLIKIKEHIEYSLQAIKMMATFKRPIIQLIKNKKIKLIKKQFYKDKKTIIFDLDETLIHCNQNHQQPSDIKLKIKFHDQQFPLDASINFRPFLKQTLQILSQKFQLIIFTASHQTYANAILDHIDPDHKYFAHRLYRDSCIQLNQGILVKDLRILENRNLNEIVLVDNAAYSYFYQLENGIPIIPYYKGKKDSQLKRLIKYLLQLQKCVDVREVNKKTFKLDQYLNFSDHKLLITKLYNKNGLNLY